MQDKLSARCDAGETDARKARLAALVTCHNRAELTLKCLSRLFMQTALDPSGNAEASVFLVDDGSSDGTADRVRTQFPQVRVLQGDGSLYWAGGMRLAWATAAGTGGYDGFLLLNDDTLLEPTALSVLLATTRFISDRHGIGGIAVGSVLDGQNKHAYGGKRWWGGTGDVIPRAQPEPCDLFNCNVTFVSASVYEAIGGFSEVFTHSMADYEYACRAHQAGIPCYVAPSYLGTCAKNAEPDYRDPRISLRRRWGMLQSPKGLPFREYSHLCRAMYAWQWPAVVAVTYLEILFPSLRACRKRAFRAFFEELSS